MNYSIKLTILSILIILALALAGLATYFFVYKKAPLLNKGPEIPTIQDLNNGYFRYFFKGKVVEINPKLNEISVQGSQGHIITFFIYSQNYNGQTRRQVSKNKDVPSDAEITAELKKVDAEIGSQQSTSVAVVAPTPTPSSSNNPPSYTTFLGISESSDISNVDKIFSGGESVIVTFITDYKPDKMKSSTDAFIGPDELYFAESVRK